jgi:glycosyltransferase involved in cell wall biosynthesis
VAITRILNEADIVEAFARHTRHFVDAHIFVDNGSTDGTLAILAALKAEGLPIEVYANGSVSFSEAVSLNFLFRRAVEHHRADWVIPLDTDEFIDLRGLDGTLAEYLKSRGDQPARCIKIRWRQYVACPEDDPAVPVPPQRIVHAQAQPTAYLKIILAASLLAEGIEIQPGFHSATMPDGSECGWFAEDRILLAHYSERSPWQWIAKFVVGWSKVLAAGSETLNAGHAEHYRTPFAVLRDRPAQILREPIYMEQRHGRTDLQRDPIHYLGGVLRYTPLIEPQMRLVQSLLAFVEALATQHGRLVTHSAEARALVDRWNREFTPIE